MGAVMGLLDSLFAGGPGQQGLLAGSAALLNAGGPSRMPISFGQGVAQALTAGQGAYADAQTQMLKKQMQELQLKEYERKMKEAQEADEKRQQLLEIAKRAVIPGDPGVGEVGAPHWSGLGNTFTPEGPKGFNKEQFVNDLYGIDPLKALELSQKPDDLMTVAPGATVWDKRKGVALYTTPDKADKPPAGVQEYQYAVQNDGFKGTYTDWVKAKAAAGRAQINTGGTPYFQPVQTAQGVMAFNARTGKMELVTDAGGKPIVGAAADPTLQGTIAGAKKGAQVDAEIKGDATKANLTGDKLLAAVDEAERLLKLGPTGSGVGAVVDAAGRVVGQTSKSAKLASRLETLAGWMTSNVPRMEGPQSNFDLENYKTMAAKVGDRTVPPGERLEALKTLKDIQQKYKHLNTKTSNVDDLVNKHRSK